ncbi:hypothetical protein OYT1_ch1584 [Ferriphaselus amnicola]|uniref:Head completion/stabilization protein n=1 Tax=Ferriphaselus amnicola TaxID=1188319 RepID=A0A2Z6GBY9_9PROT|nr:head completion/stabilization protein [Ferriphaselus amnicola]BBE51131.1 hypothetical protein OYT1_ch1584 [Ferriphaselus amnicola]
MIFPGQQPTPADTQVISNGDFWPEIELATLRTDHRIDGTVTDPRLRTVAIEAIATVNDELEAWRSAKMLAGYSTLDEVPAKQVDDTSVLVHRYQRAVGCLAKAMLTERYRDLDTTAAGNKKADVLDPTIDDLRRDARWAISDILCIGRSTVELI